VTRDLYTDWHWQPPASWLRITTIDTHTGGEPLRIVTSGLPPIPGATVLDKRRYFMENLDHLRTGILREPRGHSDMYGAIVTAADDDADLDVFFLNTVGYSPMCGHAILAIAKVALETGLVVKEGESPELVINVPPGRNYARATRRDGRVTEVAFRNVPSFVSARDGRVEVPGYGGVNYDLAFGGAFYAIVEAAPLGLGLRPEDCPQLIDAGRRIKAEIVATTSIEHPTEPAVSSLFGVIFTGPPEDPAHHSRNVTIFEDGEVDRSATGTGVSARAALLAAQGRLREGERIVIESIIGSTMTVGFDERLDFAGYAAITPEVAGEAHIMGRSELLFDPDDPYGAGFMIR
jgi:trans-L-3-hydroxyproline dehydratase